jgi:heat shock protein HslJ
MTRHSLLLCTFLSLAATTQVHAEYQNGIEWQPPKKITPGKSASDAPSDAVVLFDGENLDEWNGGDKWKIENGEAVVGRGGISTKKEFGDCQLHIEWSSPNPPSGEGQGCANSGVFMMGTYEIQVLDSYSTDTYHDGQAGAVYKQKPPAVNAMRKPGEWNTYDIYWTAPRFDEAGKLKSPAYVTVVHNGVLIHNHLELLGDTPFHRAPEYNAHGPKGPISLQDHGNPVRYRNIWVREYKPAEGKQVRDPYLKDGDKETPIKTSNTSSIHGNWKLVSLAGAAVKTDGDTPTLDISNEGSVSGSTGVNRMMGKLAGDDSDKIFGPIASTKRAGSSESMKLESNFTRALAATTRYEVTDGKLHLFAGDKEVAVLEPASK